MATQLLCHRTYLLHLSALSSLRNLCRSRHRLKQTTGPLYLDQNPSENQVIGQIWLFWDICSVCEVGWWIYVSIDRRPLPGRSGEDREGQHQNLRWGVGTAWKADSYNKSYTIFTKNILKILREHLESRVLQILTTWSNQTNLCLSSTFHIVEIFGILFWPKMWGSAK